MTGTTQKTPISPSLGELLHTALGRAQDGIHVALPGKVEKYDAARQCADVKPLLQPAYVCHDGTLGVDELPVLVDVPVVFPRGGGYFLTFPLERGDNVLILVVDRSIDDYVYSDGSKVQDADLRSHDLSDAVCLPGFFPFLKSVKDVVIDGVSLGKEGGVQARFTGTTVEITKNGLPMVMAGDFVALARLVSAELAKIQTALATHVHPGVTVGPGSTGPAAPIYMPEPVASSNLKAE